MESLQHINPLIAALTGLIAEAAVVYGLYVKAKKEGQRVSEEIRSHTEVSVTKLNGMLRYVIQSFSTPCWIKIARENPSTGDIEFRMLEMNSLYSETFGIDRANYIGKTDLEAGWDHETATALKNNDLIVWASGEPQTFTEVINGKPLRFRKIRITSPDGSKKGVMGYALDCGDPSGCGVQYSKQLNCAKYEPHDPTCTTCVTS